MAVIITGADELKRGLATAGAAVLPALGEPLLAVASAISSRAAAAAPSATGELRASAFTSGPEVNEGALSSTVTTGYEAEHAPYVHEGFFGERQGRASKWLERAAQGQEQQLADLVGDALMKALAQHFGGA